jgi:hypothetical protein
MQEINMSSDSQHFPPVSEWLRKGFAPNEYGRYIDNKDEIGLPLYQGGMIHQFDFAYKKWLSGYGKGALWEHLPFDNKAPLPCYVMDARAFSQLSPLHRMYRLAYRPIGPATNTRTMMSAVLPQVPCGHSIIVLWTDRKETSDLLIVSSLLNSLTFDYLLRQRHVSHNLSWFVIAECPIPSRHHVVEEHQPVSLRLVTAASALTFIHRLFAPEWLKLKTRYTGLCEKEWKHWWAVTEADRLRLRVEIDALCADLYGLRPDEFDWIVRDDRKDPKGFYRVDRALHFRERLTGLAAAAFRALKEGKWSAESATKLSNDEFFEVIGIPEMTTGPEPLIRKRDGCQRWKPEEFAKNDPRYGWTWDHCWQDAVALLGSEEAVRKYIESGSRNDEEGEDGATSEHPGPKDLFGNRIPTDLFGSELQRKSRKKKRS